MTVNELMHTLRMVTNQNLEVKIKVNREIYPVKSFEVNKGEFIIKDAEWYDEQNEDY